MATISSAGIGSGIEIEGLITSLVQAESEAATQALNSKEADVTLELTGYATLKGAVADFKDSLKSLSLTSTFTQNLATSADSSIFTASADSTAAAGTFNVEVTALAANEKRRSAYFDNSSSVVGTGTLTISSSTTSFDLSIDSNSQTLSGIRDAINNASNNTLVDATLLTTASGTSLLLTARDTGTTNSITLAGTSGLENFADQMMDSKQIASAAFATGTTDIGTVSGDLTITIGATTSNAITITDGVNDNLEAIRDAINAEVSINSLVTASLVKAENGVQLVLTADDPNASETISVAGTGTLQTGFTDNFATSSYLIQAGANAAIKLDGQTVTSSTNTFTEVLTGVNINVAKVSNANEETTLTLGKDLETIKTTVQALVQNYGSFLTTLQSLTEFDPETLQGGPLLGNSIARAIEVQVRRTLSIDFTENSAIRQLKDLGFETELSGVLKLNNDTLDNVLNTNYDEVVNFFTTQSTGFATQLVDFLDQYDQLNGLIEQKTDSLDVTIADISTQREALNLRLIKYEERLRSQFIYMDQVVANLRSQSSFISQQFDNLPGFSGSTGGGKK